MLNRPIDVMVCDCVSAVERRQYRSVAGKISI